MYPEKDSGKSMLCVNDTVRLVYILVTAKWALLLVVS